MARQDEEEGALDQSDTHFLLVWAVSPFVTAAQGRRPVPLGPKRKVRQCRQASSGKSGKEKQICEREREGLNGVIGFI